MRVDQQVKFKNVAQQWLAEEGRENGNDLK
jgi:hypothetical protein